MNAERDNLPVLNIAGVNKTYKRGNSCVQAVKNVSLTLQRREFAFLCGPSGSGKTTLLKIVGCLLKPDSGEVWLDGVNAAHANESTLGDFRRNKIGFVFQRFNLVRGLSAIENVMLPLSLARPAEKKSHRFRASSLLDSVGLLDEANTDPAMMSVGQCQRIAIARALVASPKLVLADEPTASLDSENGLKSIELLRGVTRHEGASCLVITHDRRIMSLKDRVIEMEDGEIAVAPSTINKLDSPQAFKLPYRNGKLQESRP